MKTHSLLGSALHSLQLAALVNAALFGFLFAGQVSAAETTTLIADNYVDVMSGRLVSPGIIVVQDGIIARINPQTLPETGSRIELPGITLLPGLMDAHTHLTMELRPGWAYASVTTTAGDAAIIGAVNAKRTLMAGFTTVRDLGAPHFADIAIAKAVDRHIIPGPDIIAAGHGTGITGGHCDATGFAPGIIEASHRRGIGDSPDELAKAVRYQIKHGAKVVKVCATSGVMSHEASVGAQQTTIAELKAAAEEAHRHDIRIAAHAVGTDGIIAATTAGIDSIEHASMLTPEAARLIKEHGTFVVPTLYLLDAVDTSTFPPALLKKGMLIRQSSKDSFVLALKHEIKVVFGTDAGVIPHGHNAREFKTRVELGQSPIDAIRSATSTASELLNVPDRGKLAPGLRADIIGVAGNPLADVTYLERVDLVMKDGRLFKLPKNHKSQTVSAYK